MYITVLKMTRDSILNAESLLNMQSSYTMHQWLTQQQDKSRAEDKLLYRVIEKDDEIYLYIQSKSTFNVSNINEYGFVFVKSFNIDDIIEKANSISFDLQTFPYTTYQDKRLYIKDYSKRVEWLKRQFSERGIQLIDCIEYKHSPIILDKGKVKPISTSTYKGIAKIIDKEAFAKTIINGFGRFKNFGCGLILFKECEDI